MIDSHYRCVVRLLFTLNFIRQACLIKNVNKNSITMKND